MRGPRARRTLTENTWRAPTVILILGLLGSLAATSTQAPSELSSDLAAQGARLFVAAFTPEQGLGPLFNAQSCVACHNAPSIGGMAKDATGLVARVGLANEVGVDPLVGRGGPIARTHSVAELGRPCRIEAGVPSGANLVSLRNAPALYGLGIIDTIPDEVILAGAVPRGDGVEGRPHWVQGADGAPRVGRFGWKADTARLEQFVADAMRNELGITNPLATRDWTSSSDAGTPWCAGETDGLEDDGSLLASLTAYVASLPPPTLVGPSENVTQGQALFGNLGCASCHTPSLASGGQNLWLYSDLLLHDVGRDLDDGLPQGQARGQDWRTTPLWGLASRPRYLHDARARTLDAAIRNHGGEAASSAERFRALSPGERDALFAFLATL
jgi:CxxC motif-containing protein (DUF1111 family)